MEQVPEPDIDAPSDLPSAQPDVEEILALLPEKVEVSHLLQNDLFDHYGPGIHLNMPPEIYYKIPAVSSTSLKHARRSFRHFEWYVTGGECDDTSEMEFGRLAHMCLLEHERFQETVVFSDFADKRAAGYKKACKESPGKIILTQATGERLNGMFAELARNEACMSMVQDCDTEVTILVRDQLTGLLCKGRLDAKSRAKKYILDYKTCTDARPTVLPENLDATKSLRSSKFERNANELGYENQAAFYLWLCKQVGDPQKYYAVVAQEKQAPFIPCPYVYGFETVEEADEENRILINRIKDQIQLGKFPGYSDVPVVLARPSYARK